MKLAVFPLPLVLFPGGVTKLRIFEQRYLRMVKESASSEGFILSTHDTSKPHQTSIIGSHVKIIDFQTLDDGMLGIDIKAEQAMDIFDIEVEHDMLCRASVKPRPHWLEMPHNEITAQLAEKLAKLLKDNQPLSQLYPEPALDSATWVCARWVELLPILPGQKYHFFEPHSYGEAVSLLQNILLP